MIYYDEEKVGNSMFFTKIITDDKGNIVSTRKSNILLYKQIHKNHYYYVLYTSNMKVYKDFFQFLNFDIVDLSNKTKALYANALRLFYIFLDLNNYQISNLRRDEITQLKKFLLGRTDNSNDNLRCINTVNIYLSVYRLFFQYRDIECDAMFQSSEINSSFQMNGEIIGTVKRERFKSNLINNNKKNEVPKYINPTEFHTLFDLALKNKDIQSQIIFQLAYVYGLRLGEILGITIEDIVEIHKYGKLVPVIILRNRISDKQFQYCKGLKHPQSSQEYRTQDYKLNSHQIIITENFYEKIVDYVNNTFEKYIDSNNINSAIADIVDMKFDGDVNYYIFINKYGKLLSDQTWNNKLKTYFEESEIIIDKNKKQNNLTHRFRHGFAMFHAKYSSNKLQALDLQKLMRHRSLMSTMIYYNPSDEDQYNLKSDFQKELYALFPKMRYDRYE